MSTEPAATPREAIQYWYDAATERREERDRLRAVVARIAQMADAWEQQLPETIRTPAVVSAIRVALEPAAVPVPPPADRAALRPLVAAAVDEGFRLAAELEDANLGDSITGSVLAVLPEPTDRGAVLAEAADWLKAWRPEFFERWALTEQERYESGVDDAAAELRRLGAEAPTTTKPETDHQPRRGDQFEAWLKARRDEYARATGREWQALDDVLDQCRLHADTGTPLGEHVCEGRATGDCECLEAEPAAGVRQDGAQPQEPPVVAYRSPGGHYLYCTRHADELGASWTPLVSDDLPDGGLCAHSGCGVDVLIPQQGAEK